MPLDTSIAITKLRDLTVRFDLAARRAPTFHDRFCMTVPSKGADEKVALLGEVPAMREWLGNRKKKELRGATYTIVNKLWESTIVIEREDLEDDRLALYGPAFDALGSRAARHPGAKALDVLVAGESELCWDGQFFFDTDHAWGDSGAQSNDLTFNAADHTAVTPAEFLAAFEKAVNAMLSFKDDQGEPLMGDVVDELSGLTVVVPIALRQAAYKAFEAALAVGGQGASNVYIERPQIICSPRLTSGVKFYTLHTGEAIKPLIFQTRRPLQRQMKGLNDREFRDIKFMTDARYNLGYGPWWKAVLTEFN